MFPHKALCKPRGAGLLAEPKRTGSALHWTVEVDAVNVLNRNILHAFKERMKIKKRTSWDSRRGPLCQNISYFKMLHLDEQLNLCQFEFITRKPLQSICLIILTSNIHK